MSDARLVMPNQDSHGLDEEAFTRSKKILEVVRNNYKRPDELVSWDELVALGVDPLMTPLMDPMAGVFVNLGVGPKTNMLGVAVSVGLPKWLDKFAAEFDLSDLTFDEDQSMAIIKSWIRLIREGGYVNSAVREASYNFILNKLIPSGCLRINWVELFNERIFSSNPDACIRLGEMYRKDTLNAKRAEHVERLAAFMSRADSANMTPSIVSILLDAGQFTHEQMTPAQRFECVFAVLHKASEEVGAALLDRLGVRDARELDVDASLLTDPLRDRLIGKLSHAIAGFQKDANLIRYVDLAMRCGIDLEQRLLDHGATMLYEALARGGLGLAEHLLAQGADINAFDMDGGTALHALCRRGDTERLHLLRTVKFAIERGIDLNHRDSFGALATAGYGLMSDYVHVAMGRQSRHGQGHLEMMIRAGLYDIAQEMVEAGAPLDTVADSGQTLQGCLRFGALNNDGLVDALRGRGFDFNASFSTRLNEGVVHTNLPLLAARFGRWGEVMNLLTRGILDVNAKDSDDRSVLGYAVKAGDVKVVAALIDAGADIDQKFGRKSLLQTARDEVVRDYLRSSAAAKAIVGSMDVAAPKKRRAKSVEAKPQIEDSILDLQDVPSPSRGKFSPL